MDYYSLGIVTIVVLLYTSKSLWSLYNLKAFLHPGLLFCLLWSVTISSILISDSAGAEFYVVSPEYVNELFIFVLWTAIVFYLLRGWGKKKISSNFPQWSVNGFEILYKYAAPICLMSAIVGFFLAGGSFNLNQMRQMMVERETALFMGETAQTFAATMRGFCGEFNQLLLIYSGWLMFDYYLRKAYPEMSDRSDCPHINLFWMLIPSFSVLFNTLEFGGRNSLIIGFRLLFFGVLIRLAGNSKVKLQHLKKLIYVLVFLLFVFVLYSNYNSEQRMMDTGKEQRTELQKVPVVSQIFSVVNYLSSSVYGYQLRRYDFVSPELEWGQNTFSGLISWQLPFAGLMNLNLSIGGLLGLERGYSMKQMFLQLEQERNPYFSLIVTMFMTLYDDFGFWGTLVVLTLMVVVTQYFYYQWFCSDHSHFFGFYFLLLFFWMWSNSIFDPLFTAGYARMLLYMMIIAEAGMLVFRKRKFCLNQGESHVPDSSVKT